MSGKGRVVSGNEKKGGEINETDLGMIRRRLAAIEAARKRVASAAPDASAIRSAKRAAYAKVPLWRRPIARLIRRPGNVTATARVATSAPTSQLLLEDNYEKNDGSSPNLSDSYVPPRKPSMTDDEKEKVKEIDSMIQEGQQRILDLQMKKDELQMRPNPLYNYTQSNDTFDADK